LPQNKDKKILDIGFGGGAIFCSVYSSGV